MSHPYLQQRQELKQGWDTQEHQLDVPLTNHPHLDFPGRTSEIKHIYIFVNNLENLLIKSM